MWKIAAFGLGLSTFVLAIVAFRGGHGGVPSRSGEKMPDSRGATALAAKQITFGPRAVAEAAKVASLGPAEAAKREIAQDQRKG